MSEKPIVVTVCGSMRYYNQMLALANELTLEGKIVLLPFVLKVDDPGMDERLQALHRAKIDISDEVYLIGHLGTSSREEAEYAGKSGKKIFMFSEKWTEYYDDDYDEWIEVAWYDGKWKTPQEVLLDEYEKNRAEEQRSRGLIA